MKTVFFTSGLTVMSRFWALPESILGSLAGFFRD